MDVRITARHRQVSSTLEQFIRSKIAKLERFMHRLHDANVVLATDGGKTTVEMTVGWAKGRKFSASAEGSGPKEAVTRAQNKLEKQLRRLKARLLRRRAGPEAA